MLDKDSFLLISKIYIENGGNIINLMLLNKNYKNLIERNIYYLLRKEND